MIVDPDEPVVVTSNGDQVSDDSSIDMNDQEIFDERDESYDSIGQRIALNVRKRQSASNQRENRTDEKVVDG